MADIWRDRVILLINGLRDRQWFLAPLRRFHEAALDYFAGLADEWNAIRERRHRNVGITEIRSLLYLYPNLGYTLVLLLLAGCTILAIKASSGPVANSIPNTAYYYDLNTNALFVGPTYAVPPIDAPSGAAPDGSPAGVRAHLFACGSCASPDDRFVAYLVRVNPNSAALVYASHVRSNAQAGSPPDPGSASAPASEESASPSHDEPQPGREAEIAANTFVALPDLSSGWVPMAEDQAQSIMTHQLDARCGHGKPAIECWP